MKKWERVGREFNVRVPAYNVAVPSRFEEYSNCIIQCLAFESPSEFSEASYVLIFDASRVTACVDERLK